MTSSVIFQIRPVRRRGSASLRAPLHLRYQLKAGKRNWFGMICAIPLLTCWGYKIYRKPSSEKVYHLLPADTTNAGQNYFTDSTMTTGLSYDYRFLLIDYFGNESALSYPVTLTVNPVLPSPPAGLRVSSDEGGVSLSWGELVGDYSFISKSLSFGARRCGPTHRYCKYR